MCDTVIIVLPNLCCYLYIDQVINDNFASENKESKRLKKLIWISF